MIDSNAVQCNAASRVRCVQCGIRLPRELSGAGPEVQGLSPLTPPARRRIAGNTCVLLRTGLLRLFHGSPDIVDLVLRHFYGASGWDTSFYAGICCMQYGPAGDVIAAGAEDGGIHLICAHTGAKILCVKGHR